MLGDGTHARKFWEMKLTLGNASKCLEMEHVVGNARWEVQGNAGNVDHATYALKCKERLGNVTYARKC